MRNLQIGNVDLHGKRFNGHDLHHLLALRGIESNHLVFSKLSQDASTFEIAQHIPNRWPINTSIRELERGFGVQSLLYPFGYELFYNSLFLEADLVHYHLIHDHFFSLTLLPFLTRLKPSIWTLHDPWALTGHCIHPFGCLKWMNGCGDCPDLATEFSIPIDNTALNWEIKKFYYWNSDIDIIVASKFMFDMVRQSELFSKFRLHHIPFGLDINIFRPKEIEKARKRFGINVNSFVLSFRAMQWPLKGLDYVKQVLQQLVVPQDTCLLVFNEKDLLKEFEEKYRIIELGWIFEDDELVDAYNAADLFLMPSTAEAFGMMAIEAMACGKPVVAFNGTALNEVLFAPDGGVTVPQGNVEALVRATQNLIDNPVHRRQIGERSRELALEHYHIDTYVNRVIDLYSEVIARKKYDARTNYLLDQLKKATIVSSSTRKDVTESTFKISAKKVLSIDRKNRIMKYLEMMRFFFVRFYNLMRKMYRRY